MRGHNSDNAIVPRSQQLLSSFAPSLPHLSVVEDGGRQDRDPFEKESIPIKSFQRM